MSKNKHLEWSNYCQLAWETLKQKVSIAPILRGPNWSFPFLISTDASNTTLGGVLGQQEYHKPYAIYFISKNITVAKLNYTVTEKEFMSFIYTIDKFLHYIIGYPVTHVHIDHSVIKYLTNKPITNGRVTLWLLLLQEFDISIMDRPGKTNVVVDFLSTIINNEEPQPVDDAFLDEHLFAISTNVPWFADVANYLVAGKLLGHMK